MRAVPREVVEIFAREFAGERKGFSLKEITDYFSRYSNMVKPSVHYGFTPKRSDLFIEALYSLLPKEQYYALTDLCLSPPNMRHAVPTEEERNNLLCQLHSYLNVTPVGLKFSSMREHIFRQDWFTAYNRIVQSPASAITAARTMLESIFQTVISERGITPDTSLDLSGLLKQTMDVLNFNRAQRQEEHRILNGLTNIINGVCGLSNVSGDRHGSICGLELSDPKIANLVVFASGTVGLFFIELHLFTPLITQLTLT